MKGFIILLALTITWMTRAGAVEHVQATKCQFYVDRVVAYNGPQGSRSLRFYFRLKLNSKVEEAGFWHQFKRVDFWHRQDDFGPWHTSALETYFGASDYYTIALPISNDNESFVYQGEFFVRTSDDRVYWLNANLRAGDNFVFNNFAFDNVLKVMGVYYNYDVSPQRAVRVPYYNPAACD